MLARDFVGDANHFCIVLRNDHFANTVPRAPGNFGGGKNGKQTLDFDALAQFYAEGLDDCDDVGSDLAKLADAGARIAKGGANDDV